MRQSVALAHRRLQLPLQGFVLRRASSAQCWRAPTLGMPLVGLFNFVLEIPVNEIRQVKEKGLDKERANYRYLRVIGFTTYKSKIICK